MRRVALTTTLSVPAAALTYRFVRSSVPGGQNVNRVAAAVELRFDLDACDWPCLVLSRLEAIAGRRISRARKVVVFAQRFRALGRNRAGALERLCELVARAERPTTPHVSTRQTRASKVRPRETKNRRSQHKACAASASWTERSRRRGPHPGL